MPSQEPFDVPSLESTTEADVIIFRLFSGDYRLVFDAYYGCGAHRQFVYAQTLGP
jgi:hypothetical protein